MIKGPYLLVLNVPLAMRGGRPHADKSWSKDLSRHLDYIEELVLFCPVERDFADDLIDVSHPGLRVVGLSARSSFARALLDMPRVAALLWREIGRAQVVHVGLAGWPIPFGWPATLIARLRRKPIVAVIESAFWRSPADAPFVRRLVSRCKEAIVRTCVAQADYVEYTQAEYSRSLPASRGGGGHIIQASWIDEEDILADAALSWAGRPEDRPLRLLFAGRLVPEKGVRLLLDAVARARSGGIDVECDVIGTGPDAGAVTRAGDGVRLLSPVTYGPDFFALLRGYDAVVVPSLSDEQPRIVYDAFSQAIPVIASDTAGLRQCVRDGDTGLIFPAGDTRKLLGAITMLAQDRGLAPRLGAIALAEARAHTHRGMHAARERRLAALLSL